MCVDMRRSNIYKIGDVSCFSPCEVERVYGCIYDKVLSDYHIKIYILILAIAPRNIKFFNSMNFIDGGNY